MMDKKLKKLFGIDEADSTEDSNGEVDETATLLADVPQEDKQTLYTVIPCSILAGLYGENTDFCRGVCSRISFRYDLHSVVSRWKNVKQNYDEYLTE